MVNVGPLELILVLIIALIVLGPARLPEVARSVGRGMREFRSALASQAGVDEDDEDDEDDDEDDDDDEIPDMDAEPPALPAAPPGSPEDLPERS